MKTLLTATAAAMIATSSFASDWTATYVGAQIGYADAQPSGGVASGNGGTVGIHFGFDYDFGDWVLGGELDWDRLKIDVGNPTSATIDDIARFKLKAGYDFGNVLGYVVVGPARINTNLGNKTDAFYGLGLSFLATEEWSFTGEYLYHKFKNVGGTGSDVKLNAFALRASYRF